MTEINTIINRICNDFVNASYEDMENIVNVFDETDSIYIRFDGNRMFDKHRLRQLLTYIKDNKLKKFDVDIYSVLDGRYGYCPEEGRRNLVINLQKLEPYIRSTYSRGVAEHTIGFRIEPECHSPSGGNYLNTRADIKLKE
jgi:hypothetical protein